MIYVNTTTGACSEKQRDDTWVGIDDDILNYQIYTIDADGQIKDALTCKSFGTPLTNID